MNFLFERGKRFNENVPHQRDAARINLVEAVFGRVPNPALDRVFQINHIARRDAALEKWRMVVFRRSSCY